MEKGGEPELSLWGLVSGGRICWLGESSVVFGGIIREREVNCWLKAKHILAPGVLTNLNS